MKLTTLAKPADFPFEVKMHDLAGAEVTIPFVGIGRTLRDWMPVAIKRIEAEANERIADAEKRQELIAEAENPDADGATLPNKQKKAKRIKLDADDAVKNQEEALDKAVAKVREFACGWGLDLEFSDENIKELIAQYPGIQGDGWAQYDARVKGNRVKN